MDRDYLFCSIKNKTPQGAVKYGTSVSFQVKVAKRVLPISVNLCLEDEKANTIEKIDMFRESADETFFTYQTKTTFKNAGLYWYYFEVAQKEHTFYLQKDQTFDCQPVGQVTNKFLQYVYQKDLAFDSSLEGGIIYHIFVDRFCKVGKVPIKKYMNYRSDWGGSLNQNTNNPIELNKEYFGGNLAGIKSKLNYLKSLGVSVIYLSPIFESNSYHKYDTADYNKIDQSFGSDAILKNLITTAKQMGIGIIIDGVFNHTGSDSVYFNKEGHFDSIGAYQSQQSKYFGWYNFTNFPNDYSSWWGIETLPQVCESNPDYQNFLTSKNGIINKYMQMGLLGFRLDVVDELGDELLNKICKSIRLVKKDALIVGEVWEDAASKIAYGERRKYFFGEQLNSVTNYPLKQGIIDYVTTFDPKKLLSAINIILDHYPASVQKQLMNIIGTHDTKRILNVFEDCKNQPNIKQSGLTPVEMLKIASLLQFTLMGLPTVFYGDEVGLTGSDAPLCRRCFPWGQENLDILNWYKLLGKLRRQNKCFKDGNTSILHFENGVFVFSVASKKNKVVVAVNLNEQPFYINFEKEHINFLTNQKILNAEIAPYGYGVYVVK